MASKKYNFTHKEIMAGAMVLLSLFFLVAFIAVVKGMRPPVETNRYFTTFSKTIGLKAGADISWGGVPAGFVTAIEPDPERKSKIRVTAALFPFVPVNTESLATIEQISLTAEKHLEISTGSDDAPLLEEGSEIKSVTLSGGFVDLPDLDTVVSRVEDILEDAITFLGVDEAQELEEKGEKEFAKVTRIAADVRDTLNEGTGFVRELRDTLNDQRPNIEAILAKVQDIEDGANGLLSDLNAVLNENRGAIDTTIEGVESIVTGAQDAIGKVTSKLDGLLEALEATLNNAELLSDNAQDFLADNRTGIEDIVFDLKETIRNLKTFSRTLAEQPHAIIRGKSPDGRK